MDRPQSELQPPASDEGGRLARRVLLIGWDGAEYGTLLRYLQSGRLPHLNSLIESGARLELSVPRPAVAPAAWTSLATGAWPHQHGILHKSRPRLNGVGIEPIQRSSRRSPAIWDILTSAGQPTHVVGWPISHPADVVSGVFVSDEFAMPIVRDSSTPSLGAAILPADMEPALRSRRVTPSQIQEVTLSQLLPREVDTVAEHHKVAAICRGVLAEAATLFRALRWCLAERPWEFAACMFPGIRSCHELANWTQTALQADSEFREQLLAGCYEHHDLLLGQLLQQVGDDTHIFAVALAERGAGAMESGLATDSTPSTGAVNRTVGLAAIRGPGVLPKVGIASCSMVDVTPTILAMLGLPYGSDMAGRPWTDLFQTNLRTTVIDSWTPLVDDTPDAELQREHAAAVNAPNSSARDQSVAHLVELGYVDPHDTAAQQAAENCRRTTAVNRAGSLLDAQMFPEAVSCLEQLAQQYPDWYPLHASLAEAYYRMGDRRFARREIAWLTCRGIEQPQIYYLAAAIEFADRKYEQALAELVCAWRGNFKFPGTRTLAGQIYLRKQDFAAAETAFHSAVEFEGPSPQTLDGLAAVNLHFERWEQAAVNALDAVAHDMQFARSHYHLGLALAHLARPHEALRAFETWAAIEPGRAAPYRWMAGVCQRLLGDANRAAEYVARGRAVVRQRRAAVTLVSGADASAPSSLP